MAKLLEPDDFGGVRGWVRAGDVEMAPDHWGRPLRRGDVIYIGKNFDPDQFGEVHIWRRDELPVGGGRYVVIDGQHRIRALVDVMGWGAQSVPCTFLDGITDERAAAVSRGLQRRRNLHAFDEFRMAITAGVLRAVEVDAILRGHGIALVRGGARTYQASAVGTLEALWDRLGTKELNRVVGVVARAWNGAPDSFGKQMLQVIGSIMAVHEYVIDDDRLIRTLQVKRPAEWLVGVGRGGSRHIGHVAEEIVTTYNKRLGDARRVVEATAEKYRRSLKRSPATYNRGITVAGRLGSEKGPTAAVSARWRGR